MKLNIRNLQNNFKAFDDRILYRYYEKDKISTLTYREVDQLSDKFALYLQSKGLKKGAKMAFYCDHYLDQVIAYFACLKIGVICIPLNMELDLN